jgi:hypothetical protein
MKNRKKDTEDETAVTSAEIKVQKVCNTAN